MHKFEKRDAKSRTLVILAVVGLAAALTVGILTAVRMIRKPAASKDDPKTGIVYDSSAVEGGWDNLSPEEIAEKLNEKVAEGMINISKNTAPYLENGTAEGNVMIVNEDINLYPQQVEFIRNDTQEVIYQSKAIPVGSKIEHAALDVELPAGTYECTAMFHNLDPVSGEIIGTAGAIINIIANDNDGKLKKRVVFYCDEFGTMPPFDVLPLFSAGRSRKLTLVPIIQSLAQLEKNYGKEGAEIIADNCQDTIFGGFAPNSQTAETLSKALGSRTVLTGSISKGKDSNSQSLQMAERALLSPVELKSLPKGEFVVMKTGTHPMRTKLQLYFKWGIKFEEPYQTPERAQREVYYAGKEELLMNIKKSLYSQPQPVTISKADGYMSSYGDK